MYLFSKTMFPFSIYTFNLSAALISNSFLISIGTITLPIASILSENDFSAIDILIISYILICKQATILWIVNSYNFIPNHKKCTLQVEIQVPFWYTKGAFLSK